MQRTDDSTLESNATTDRRTGAARRATAAELPTRTLAVVVVTTGLIWVVALALTAPDVAVLLAAFACLLTLPVVLPYATVRTVTAILRYREGR
ncbi:hypothetical protein [Halococcus hamelinensis]|uniref:Uncharacterized protein n=1 Tax=Halococcus hamelinensis 100A6 TaxID=1132509 RepID=M0M2L0_9EURY|nr:hypothetical protein [Halococcus hamelinensis]EMA38849.1 hypothetical protein C447_08503 [Halococcus hamelinensis 100A6]